MEWLAQRAASMVIQKGIAPEEDRTYYNYCFEVMFSTCTHVLTLLFLAILFGLVFETFLYLLGFFLLRRTAGGFHANTNLTCFCMMICFYLSVSGILIFLPPAWRPVTVGVVSLFTCVTIWCLSPVTHENRPVTEEERKKFRRTSCILATAFSLAVGGALLFAPQMGGSIYLLAFVLGNGTSGISLLLSFVHGKVSKLRKGCV